MRNKIEVGEWVRTIDGLIGILKWIDGDNAELTRPYRLIKSKDIVKHSKNKIDLFKDKDIIKIKLSEKYVHNKQQQEQFMIAGKATTQISTIKEDVESGTYEIISILTHEQFKEREYVF